MTRAKLPFVALKVLEEKGPCSCTELGALMGMTREAARNHVRFLSLLEPKVIYIQGWKPALGYGKGSGGPIWAAGDLPNEPQPPQIGRRPKVVREEDDEEYLEKSIRAEVKVKAESIKPFRHWQDAALFGEARS